MKLFLIIIFCLIILYFLLTYIMFILICKKFNAEFLPMLKIVEKTLKPYKDIIKEGEEFIEKKYKNKEVKDVYIKSSDNLKLHGIFIEHKNPKGIMIEAHGYRSTVSRDLYPSCHQYYKMGYSILLIDHRTSNKSEGKYITFGIKESKDIISWIHYINKKYPHNSVILAGVSMGASSILMSLKYITKKMNVKCALVDSGYISAYDQISYCIKHYFHINGKLFINAINMWCKLIGKFDLRSEDTIKSLSVSNIPVLFVHGEVDDFVPVINTTNNYESYNGKKEIMIFKDATHGISYLVDSKKYIRSIKKFLSKYNT